MKRLFLAALCLTLTISPAYLAGAEENQTKTAESDQQSSDTGNEADEEDKVKSEEMPGKTSIANPWEDLTAEELLSESGLSFEVPKDAKNVIYRYLKSDNLAEMQFTLDSDEFCARIKPADEPLDISGMYFKWENEEEVNIGECAGTIGQAKADNKDYLELCQWYDADQKLQYSLSVNTTELDGLDLTAVAEQIYKK